MVDGYDFGFNYCAPFNENLVEDYILQDHLCTFRMMTIQYFSYIIYFIYVVVIRSHSTLASRQIDSSHVLHHPNLIPRKSEAINHKPKAVTYSGARASELPHRTSIISPSEKTSHHDVDRAKVMTSVESFSFDDMCSISKGFSNIGDATLIGPKTKPMNTVETYSMGAIVSTYSGLNSSASYERWRCQIKNHEKYCSRHGYKCYFLTDTEQYINGRSSILGHLTGYWIKIQALRDILPQHPWVLYLDIDTVFDTPESTMSIESLLNLHAINDKDMNATASLYMPGGIGWITNVMMFIRSDWSHRFLTHFWNLRHYCPECIGEQCAAHIALLDAILSEIQEINSNSTTERSVFQRRIYPMDTHQQPINTTLQEMKVDKDRGRTCCSPISMCRYPDGIHFNPNHSIFVQGVHTHIYI